MQHGITYKDLAWCHNSLTNFIAMQLTTILVDDIAQLVVLCPCNAPMYFIVLIFI